MADGKVRTGEETTFTYNGGVVGNILSVTPPGWERAAVPKTRLSSDHKEYRPGKIPDFGTVSFRIQDTSSGTGHAALKAAHGDKTPRECLVSYFDEDGAADGTDAFAGFVTEYRPEDAEDEANIEATVTIQVTRWGAAPGGG